MQDDRTPSGDDADAVCESCGKTFTPKPKTVGRFCSRACVRSSYGSPDIRSCAHCGTTFDARNGNTQHCSRACRTANPAPEVRSRRRGPHAPGDYAVNANGCWVWQMGLTRGYAVVNRTGDKRKRYAHRWYYEQLVGPIPDGLVLDHLCRNKACVNPAHLEPVTQKVNTQRSLTARLNPAAAAEIRASDLSGVALAERYGVCQATISAVRTGKTWV